jgi:hypothetical protein
LLVLGCLLLVLGCWFLVLGCWFLVACCWFLVAGSWFLVAGSWLLVLFYWFAGLGSTSIGSRVRIIDWRRMPLLEQASSLQPRTMNQEQTIFSPTKNNEIPLSFLN